DRSPAAVWRRPPLLLAAAGGTVTLAALPVDAAWHASFGRDAVLWSPPHMLAVFGSLALLVGLLAAVGPGEPGGAAAGQRGRPGAGVRDRRAAVQRDAVPSRPLGDHAVRGDGAAPGPPRTAASRASGRHLRAVAGGDRARPGRPGPLHPRPAPGDPRAGPGRPAVADARRPLRRRRRRRRAHPPGRQRRRADQCRSGRGRS